MAKIIWFTGLSGSGKSTLSKKIISHLRKKKFKYFYLDGDKFRLNKKHKNNFSRSSIKKNNLLIIDKIKMIKSNYDFIIISAISPLKITRNRSKKFFNKDYIEVFVDCPLKELIKRDTKGLYKLAIKNKIKNLIGFNSNIKYEKTRIKKIIVKTNIKNISQSKNFIIQNLNKKFNVQI